MQRRSYDQNGTLLYTEYYFRDGQGNTMGIYRQAPGDTLVPIEHTIYTTGRLGTYYRQTATSTYEIKDHLGSVRATIDREPATPPGDTTLRVVMTFWRDYYPFGWNIPGRESDGSYRYAFQGQELDEETGWLAFQLRMYDARVGRWMSTDPAGEFSSPYLAMGNRPATTTDPDGGHTETDFFNLKGEYVGTDGIDNGKIEIVDIISIPITSDIGEGSMQIRLSIKDAHRHQLLSSEAYSKIFSHYYSSSRYGGGLNDLFSGKVLVGSSSRGGMGFFDYGERSNNDYLPDGKVDIGLNPANLFDKETTSSYFSIMNFLSHEDRHKWQYNEMGGEVFKENYQNNPAFFEADATLVQGMHWTFGKTGREFTYLFRGSEYFGYVRWYYSRQDLLPAGPYGNWFRSNAKKVFGFK